MQTNLVQLLYEYKLPLFLTLLGLILLGAGLIFSGSKEVVENYPTESLVTQPRQIAVDISGAVKSPGVYELPEGSRIQDVIEKAGGFVEDTHQEYVTKTLNMAQKVVDGSKLYIPFENEDLSTIPSQAAVAGTNSSKVNINTASQTELEALSGIGPVTASKVIANRPYQKIEELVSKRVISQSLLDKLKDFLVLY